jgi:hypothetical protein
VFLLGEKQVKPPSHSGFGDFWSVSGERLRERLYLGGQPGCLCRVISLSQALESSQCLYLPSTTFYPFLIIKKVNQIM